MEYSLLIVTGIYPPDSGGPASFSEDFALWVSNRKIKVAIITYTDDASRIDFIGQIKVTFIHRHRNLVKRYLLFIKAIFENYNPTVKIISAGAFLETWVASLVGRFSYTVKIPGDIVWERARNAQETKLDIEAFQNSSISFKYRLFRQLYNLSINKSQTIIVPSQFLGRMVSNWLGSSRKITLIYNSIDVNKFTLSEKNEMFDVLTMCRLVPWKGVDELIHCCADLGLSLGVAGEGPEEERLKELASSLGASVTFFGQIPKSEVSSFYARGKIFVLNSSYEGLPHVLVEAKSSGLVCIAKSKTGSEEVIRDMLDGILVRDETGLDLRESLRLITQDCNLASKLSSRARKDVLERFDRDVNFEKILSVLIES